MPYALGHLPDEVEPLESVPCGAGALRPAEPRRTLSLANAATVWMSDGR